MKGLYYSLRTCFVVFSLFCILPGCATIVKGTTQSIPIDSDPNNADVIVDGHLRGQTPLSVELKRKRDHLITIQKTGYHSKGIPIIKDIGGAVWGNILVGGVIGWGVDASSGAQYNLRPASVFVKLVADEHGDGVEDDAGQQSEFVSKLNELDVLKDNKSVSKDEYDEMRAALFKEYYPEMEAAAPDK